jgi:hypothetical protein
MHDSMQGDPSVSNLNVKALNPQHWHVVGSTRMWVALFISPAFWWECSIQHTYCRIKNSRLSAECVSDCRISHSWSPSTYCLLPSALHQVHQVGTRCAQQHRTSGGSVERPGPGVRLPGILRQIMHCTLCCSLCCIAVAGTLL